jgi:hypothetical protein
VLRTNTGTTTPAKIHSRELSFKGRNGNNFKSGIGNEEDIDL